MDNDHGLITSGADFVARIRRDPAWDWRLSSVDFEPRGLDDGLTWSQLSELIETELTNNQNAP
jgi:hypothetical protein